MCLCEDKRHAFAGIASINWHKNVRLDLLRPILTRNARHQLIASYPALNVVAAYVHIAMLMELPDGHIRVRA